MEPGYQNKTRGKGLKKLRRVNSFHKKHEPEVEGVAAAIGEKKSKKKKKKKSKATREETDEKDESNSEAKNKRKAKVKEEENRSRKVAKRTSNVEAPVDDKVKKMVIDILQEFRKTHCCHPSFQAYNFNKKVFQVSVYWNRAAVGVKLHKSKISDYKGKGAFAQIAYLGCQSNCTYSNLALAHLYASCFQKFTQYQIHKYTNLSLFVDLQNLHAALKIWDQGSILCLHVLPPGQIMVSRNVVT